jgi:zinc D-Ala-D-Ala dipeptidase
MRQILLVCPIIIFIACSQQARDYFPFANCQQLVVVISPDDDSTGATLYRFEKRANTWHAPGTPHAVMLGRSGLAWGRGLHEKQTGIQKREGDGKSPAGIFIFSTAFGYAPPDSAAFRLPYVQATDLLECVDDDQSSFYNQLSDSLTIKKDWHSSEFMHRSDDLYKWGIFVDHNIPAMAGNGSCIFFHIWNGAGATTSGCTSMPEENLLALMHWLDPARHPLLVQMTAAGYRRFRKKYGVPEVSKQG